VTKFALPPRPFAIPQHPDEHRPSVRSSSKSISPPADDLGDGRRIVRGVSRERGTTPGFPDPWRQDLSIWPGPAGLPFDLSQQDMFRIAGRRADRTRLCRDTRSHLCGSDSSAVAAGNGSHQVSAFAACSVAAWPEGSRISRSRRATSRHYGRVTTGAGPSNPRRRVASRCHRSHRPDSSHGRSRHPSCYRDCRPRRRSGSPCWSGTRRGSSRCHRVDG
jgi:hypothetical protein